MGHTEEGGKVYQPLEAVYLADRGVLEILGESGLPLSLQQTFNLLTEVGIPLDHYLAFAWLWKHGFIVKAASQTTTSSQHLPPIHFEVWKARKQLFRKGSPPPPDFNVSVCSFTELVPQWLNFASAIDPLKLCILHDGVVTLASVSAGLAPTSV